MKTILTIQEQDVNPEAPIIEHDNFDQRCAARAVVLDDQGRVALLKVNLHKYHKLPGGGVEEGEDLTIALGRELLEEIGCSAKVSAEVGEIVEYRDQWNLKQTSYCYLAQQQGDQSEPDFTEEELEDGFEIIWVDSINDAISLLVQDTPKNYDGEFIKIRDTAFLKAARKQLNT